MATVPQPLCSASMSAMLVEAVAIGAGRGGASRQVAAAMVAAVVRVVIGRPGEELEARIDAIKPVLREHAAAQEDRTPRLPTGTRIRRNLAEQVGFGDGGAALGGSLQQLRRCQRGRRRVHPGCNHGDTAGTVEKFVEGESMSSSTMCSAIGGAGSASSSTRTGEATMHFRLNQDDEVIIEAASGTTDAAHAPDAFGYACRLACSPMDPGIGICSFKVTPGDPVVVRDGVHSTRFIDELQPGAIVCGRVDGNSVVLVTGSVVKLKHLVLCEPKVS